MIRPRPAQPLIDAAVVTPVVVGRAWFGRWWGGGGYACGGRAVPGSAADEVAVDGAGPIDVFAAELRDVERTLGDGGQGTSLQHAGGGRDFHAVADDRHRLPCVEEVAELL